MLEFQEVTSRLREHVQRLSPLSRWMLFLVPIVGFTACLAWWGQSLGPTTEVLFNGQPLSDGQQRPIVQALAKEKLEEFEFRDRCLYVPNGQAARYLAALGEHHALPEGLPDFTSSAFQASGIFATQREREQIMLHARERNLAAAICALKGIQDASVQFDEIDERGLQKRQLVTASVIVLPEKEQPLEFSKVTMIRQLVAGARAGLQPSDVQVTDLGGAITYVGNDPSGAKRCAAEAYLQHKQTVEKYWQQKLENVLRFISQVEVAVDAELPAPPVKDPSSKGESAEEGVLFPVNPRRLNVSVGVPRSYLLGIWKNRQRTATASQTTPPTTEDLSQLQVETTECIRQAVSALTRSGSETPDSNVTVTTFDDLTSVKEPLSAVWFPSWSVRQQFGMVIVVLGVVGFLTVQLTGRRRRQHAQPGLVVTSLPDEAPPEIGGQPSTPIPFPEVEEQRLRASLTDLVRDDPEQAAKILNQWIARAG